MSKIDPRDNFGDGQPIPQQSESFVIKRGPMKGHTVCMVHAWRTGIPHKFLSDETTEGFIVGVAIRKPRWGLRPYSSIAITELPAFMTPAQPGGNYALTERPSEWVGWVKQFEAMQRQAGNRPAFFKMQSHPAVSRLGG